MVIELFQELTGHVVGLIDAGMESTHVAHNVVAGIHTCLPSWPSQSAARMWPI